jgi:hypothetical protein
VVIAGADSFAFEIRQAGLYASFVGPSTVPGASRDGLDTYQHLLPGSPAYVVPVGTWVRLGFAHDGLDTMELYADGRVLARRRGLLAGVPGVGPTGVSLGNAVAPDMQHVLDGDIDEIRSGVSIRARHGMTSCNGRSISTRPTVGRNSRRAWPLRAPNIPTARRS